MTGFAAHSLSAVELAQMHEAERAGAPFLALRDEAGELLLVSLADRSALGLGRVADSDLALFWDPEVSRAHAQLESIGAEWMLTDDGLSRNGTFVNGDRLVARRRLRDGDVIQLGRCMLVFRAPISAGESTAVGVGSAVPTLSPAERRVLVELCRPLLGDPAAGGVPASNEAIGAALHLSLSGVKSHIRALFARFGLEAHAHYGKRTELARRALASGAVTARDL